MSKPGTLFPDYYIICAVCEYGYHVGASERNEAANEAKKQGWHRIPGKGWCCQGCADDLTRPLEAVVAALEG